MAGTTKPTEMKAQEVLSQSFGVDGIASHKKCGSKA